MKHYIRGLVREMTVLYRSIPSFVVSIYLVALISMNLLANKCVPLPTDLIVLDCGFFLSWIVFLVMDMVTRRFGPRAATLLSVTALLCNLFMCGIFYGCSLLPGYWSAAYDETGTVIESVNGALNATFGGTWYVVFGSSAAFLASAIVNNITNYFIGRKVERDKKNFFTYAIRSYSSTLIGQFVDNLVFALIVSHVFFGLSLLQCVMCALTGAIAELLMEVLFSGIGYRISKRWDEENVGKDYIEQYCKNKKASP